MTKLPTRIKIIYRSQENNGFPLIRFLINDELVDSFEAKSNLYEIKYKFTDGPQKITIEHYGKNYITDSNPDKFFELVDIYFDNLNLENLKYNFIQTPLLPPWDKQIEKIVGNLYLGHNGKLDLNFEYPIHVWMKKKFGREVSPINNQQTTKEMLFLAKKKFNLI